MRKTRGESFPAVDASIAREERRLAKKKGAESFSERRECRLGRGVRERFCFWGGR